jgi:hypothetical protein
VFGLEGVDFEEAREEREIKSYLTAGVYIEEVVENETAAMVDNVCL